MDYNQYVPPPSFDSKIKEIFNESIKPGCEQTNASYVMLGIMWVLWLAVFSMNYMAYFRDYTRYSQEIALEIGWWKITYRTFSLYAEILTIIFDIFVLWILLKNTPLLERIPTKIQLVIVAIIGVISLVNVFYTHTLVAPIEARIPGITPVLSTKTQRIVLYSFIFVINIILVALTFFQSRSITEYQFVNDSGIGECAKKGTNFWNIVVLLIGFVGNAADAISLKRQIEYTPAKYSLPSTFE